MRSDARGFLKRFAEAREKRALVLVALLTVVFLVLSGLVRTEQLDDLDHAVSLALQSSRTESMDNAAELVTQLGNGAFLTTAALVAAGVLLALSKTTASVLTLLSLIGLPINWLIKELIGRPRPTDGLVAVVLPTVGLSFPSGHAMMSVLFYGFLAFLAWTHIPYRRLRLGVTSAIALLVVLISLSRIYLGVHWLSDVLGGWTAGLFFLLLLSELYRLVGTGDLGRPANKPPHQAQTGRTG